MLTDILDFDDLIEQLETVRGYSEWDYPIEYSDAIDSVIKQLNEIKEKEKSEWISVKDRLPDDKELYLICTESNFGKIDIAYYQSIGDKFSNYEPFWQGRSSRSTRVTHWMPLPKPPKGK